MVKGEGCAWFCPVALTEMMAAGEMVDVVLVPLPEYSARASKSLRVHSLIMALASPVLRKMIAWERERTTRREERGAVVLELDASASTLQCFVEYVYHGKAPSGDATELLSLGRLADQLDVQVLRTAVLAQARNILSAETCTLFLNTARNAGLAELEDIAMQFALRNLHAVQPFPTPPPTINPTLNPTLSPRPQTLEPKP